MKWRRREYSIPHGNTGFHLEVRDVLWVYVVAEKVTEGALTLLGHPCCGRGLGRIPGTDGFWFTVLNLPNRLRSYDRRVLSLPLTTEQAVTLNPHWADDTAEDGWITVDGWDEDGEMEWRDARLHAIRCRWCYEYLLANGRYYAQIMDDHDCSDVPVPSATSWDTP